MPKKLKPMAPTKEELLKRLNIKTNNKPVKKHIEKII